MSLGPLEGGSNSWFSSLICYPRSASMSQLVVCGYSPILLLADILLSFLLPFHRPMSGKDLCQVVNPLQGVSATPQTASASSVCITDRKI